MVVSDKCWDWSCIQTIAYCVKDFQQNQNAPFTPQSAQVRLEGKSWRCSMSCLYPWSPFYMDHDFHESWWWRWCWMSKICQKIWLPVGWTKSGPEIIFLSPWTMIPIFFRQIFRLFRREFQFSKRRGRGVQQASKEKEGPGWTNETLSSSCSRHGTMIVRIQLI